MESVGDVSSIFIETLDPALWLLLLAFAAWRFGASAGAAPPRSLLAVGATAALGASLAILLCPSRVGDMLNHVIYGGGIIRNSISRYGCGVEAILVLVASFTTPTDDVLAAINVCAAATSIVLVWALARRVGYSPFVAHTAALLVAVSPLTIRFIPTHERYPLYIVTMLAGIHLLLLFFDERRPIDLAAAVVALVLSAQCRPEAIVAVGLAGVLCMMELGRPARARRSRDERRRLVGGLVAALAGLLLLLAWPMTMMLLDIRTVGGVFQTERYLDRLFIWLPPRNVFLNSAYTPRVWSALGLVGLVVAGGADRWRRAFLLVAALVLTLALGDHPVTNYQRANARYFVPSLPFYFILVASGLETALVWLRARLPRFGTPPAHRWFATTAALGVAALAMVNVPGVLRDTTADQEYRFLARALARVPAGCTVATAVWPSEDRGLQTPTGMAGPIARGQPWRRVDATAEITRRDLVSGEACAVFYMPANCYVGSPGNADPTSPESGCLRMLAEVGPALVEADLTNAPFRGEKYRGGPLHVGLYWLTQPESP